HAACSAGETEGRCSPAVRENVGFFFFQAEDGIRALTVTGVQTCALPISGSMATSGVSKVAVAAFDTPEVAIDPVALAQMLRDRRSEERRVGKECRERTPRSSAKENR